MDQAIDELQKVIRLKPEHVDAHYNLGALYLKKNLIDEAANQFKTVIRISPDNATAHYYLGTVLIRKGQPEVARAQFQEAIRSSRIYAFLRIINFGIVLGTSGNLS